MIGHILCCVDGSRNSTAAVDLASDLARKYAARLTLIHVVRDSETRFLPDELLASFGGLDGATAAGAGLAALGAEILRRHAERARENGAAEVATALETGHPAPVIAGYAQENDVGLIVMGSRGLSDLKGRLLGSIASKVLQLADCACLIVK